MDLATESIFFNFGETIEIVDYGGCNSVQKVNWAQFVAFTKLNYDSLLIQVLTYKVLFI